MARHEQGCNQLLGQLQAMCNGQQYSSRLKRVGTMTHSSPTNCLPASILHVWQFSSRTAAVCYNNSSSSSNRIAG
jgi:hypothetical protein